MPIRPSYALLAALAVIAAPAFAQDTTDNGAAAQPAETAAPEAAPAETTPAEAAPAEAAPAEATEAAPEATPAEGAAPDADAPAGTAPAEGAAAEPQAGQYYARDTHGDWTIRCVKAGQGLDPCELYQLMKDGDGNAVAEMTLIPLRNSEVAAGATLVAPLETDLMHGIGFAVDNAQPRGYPFAVCTPVGCVSRMGFTEAELNGLKRGNKAKVTLLPFGGDPKQPVELNLSLSGFTAAFDALSAYAAEAQAAAAEADKAEKTE